ncbi:MAG: hypothetical protein S4CHLAM102_09030 [Chlamydiia bacterium]|nr:hypothetical protein [Chlamydiia bacterium]
MYNHPYNPDFDPDTAEYNRRLYGAIPYSHRLHSQYRWFDPTKIGYDDFVQRRVCDCPCCRAMRAGYLMPATNALSERPYSPWDAPLALYRRSVMRPYNYEFARPVATWMEDWVDVDGDGTVDYTYYHR